MMRSYFIRTDYLGIKA